jgi:small GTP-binding protein
MIETGIKRLDEYFMGGVPEGKSLLFYVEPGVEGEKFGLQVVYNNLSQGRNVIYVISSISSILVKESFIEMRWEMSSFQNNFSIIDGYSALIGERADERLMIDDPYDIFNYEEVLEDQISAFSDNCIVVIESLSTLFDMCGEKDVLKRMAYWIESFQEREIPSIYNFIAWPYAGMVLNKVRRLFDAIIDVYSISERVIIGQCYCPTKINWGGKTGNSVPFRVRKSGGVEDYTPKICVIGAKNAGKSSFIKSLSMKPVSMKRMGSTIEFEHGFINHAGFAVDILGIQDPKEFTAHMENIRNDIIGIFLLIDSTRPSEFIWEKKLMNEIRSTGLPIIIVRNKQDLDKTFTKKDIEKKMSIPLDIPIIPTVATDKKTVLGAYEKLIEMIIDRNRYGKQ